MLTKNRDEDAIHLSDVLSCKRVRNLFFQRLMSSITKYNLGNFFCELVRLCLLDATNINVFLNQAENTFDSLPEEIFKHFALNYQTLYEAIFNKFQGNDHAAVKMILAYHRAHENDSNR